MKFFTFFFPLLQAYTPPGGDPISVLSWVAGLAVTLSAFLGGILLKALQAHPREIAALSEKHTEQILQIKKENEELVSTLNMDIRKVHEDGAERSLEYSNMLHAATDQISSVQPEIKELIKQLEEKIKDDHKRVLSKIADMLKNG